ncbi:hypothetical protein [Mesorhizobium sp. AA22]|uniref:hypothetical protein n=1 Tax=Mesorhizobium sp. AA22 TaxID=1854057 RepID=UPI0007ED39E6|nr:hypothetical protein [Mesorhizobium sp. AA22]
MRAPEQALALQAQEQVPERALELALQVPELAQALPEQASVQRAPGPASWRPAVQQALALRRFFQKHSKRQ